MRITLFIIALVFSVGGFSQTDPNDIFRNLKDGAILVRLKTFEKTIDAIKSQNLRLEDTLETLDKHLDEIRIIRIQRKLKYNNELLKKTISKRDKGNEELIEAFTNKFNLCPVYYFYSVDSKEIKEGNFNGVLFDKNLNKINPAVELKNNFLIASWSNTKADTAKYYAGTSIVQGENGLKKVDNYYGGGSYQIKALILYSPELIPLQSPFPYYVRTFEGLPFVERTKVRVVELLQFKIEKYINEWLK